MFIEYIKQHKKENGKPIPIGRRDYVLNEYADELIKKGIAKPADETEGNLENKSAENSADENETDIIPATPRKKRRKPSKKTK